MVHRLHTKCRLTIIFPLGPPFCGDQCRAERALGCGGIFPCGQQAGATVRKRRREGNEWAARVERRYTIQRTIRWLKNRFQVGPTILFECPAQIPRSSLRSFSLWARHSAETSAELNVRSGAAEFFPMRNRQWRGWGSEGGKEKCVGRGWCVGHRSNRR